MMGELGYLGRTRRPTRIGDPSQAGKSFLISAKRRATARSVNAMKCRLDIFNRPVLV